MSEANQTTNDFKANGLFAFKEGMSSVYNDSGELVPVTVLRFEPWFVSQIKTKEKDGYEAVQIISGKKKGKNSSKAEVARFKKAGFESGAQFVKEIRQEIPAGLEVGTPVSLDSLKKGDLVKVTGVSKGKGFAGSVRRWSFAGGPASHGSKFHRRPGSSGNRTWPGRVMPGKKFPGHYGVETTTVKNLEIVDVIAAENVVLVKGAVPGSRNSLIRLVKA